MNFKIKDFKQEQWKNILNNPDFKPPTAEQREREK